jgi:hypothetical protein
MRRLSSAWAHVIAVITTIIAIIIATVITAKPMLIAKPLRAEGFSLA